MAEDIRRFGIILGTEFVYTRISSIFAANLILCRMKKITICLFAMLTLVACQKKQAVETEQFTAEETIYLDGQEGDSLYIHFEIEYPIALENTLALQPIQHGITTHLFGERYAAKPIQEAMQAVIELYKTEYIRNNKMLADELAMQDADLTNEDLEAGKYSFSEVEILTGRVMNVQNGIFSYGMEQYVYTGGAHGVSNRYFYNYDLQTGALISEDDIFVEGYENALANILRQNLVAQNPETQVLDDLYQTEYDVDKIVPNDNFYFTEEGIIYVFNPYEIAPYAYGETEIFVGTNDIKELLLPAE